MGQQHSPRISRREALALGGSALVGVAGAACGSDGGMAGAAATSGGVTSGGVTSGGVTSGGVTSEGATATTTTGQPLPQPTRDAKAVALVRANDYDLGAVHGALTQGFDLLGGLAGLVSGKTVTIKPNLTGSPVQTLFGRPAGEVYITHDATIRALVGLLFEQGAARVRIVESIATRDAFSSALEQAGWNVSALSALGPVEFENTRNMGSSGGYVDLAVPAGSIYSQFTVNRAYHDTDVLISLAKLKMHVIGGVTLTMKNLYGMTPLSLYGTQRNLGEEALGYRLTMHQGAEGLPGQLVGTNGLAIESRVPRTVVDEVAARPIDLAIIDGIASMSGGEGPWNANEGYSLAATDPRLLILGWNPVATDAVATAVMGFDPLGAAGQGPFPGDNHVALAYARGLGEANLENLDVRGLTLSEARYPYPV